METSTTTHELKDAYATWDGYGIQCTCGREWLWFYDSDFTLDEMAQDAHKHCAEANEAVS